MKILYFDCFSGISGDMTLGALIDLGVDENVLIRELEKLNVSGWKLSVTQTVKNGISAKYVTVVLSDDPDAHDHKHHDHEHHEHHDHEHHDHEHHDHEHHDHEHHDHEHHDHEHHHRNFGDIIKLINESQLTDHVKRLSLNIFRRVAIAEAKVHNSTPEEVHFHEVGALDSIIDIVGTAICIDLLAPDKIYSSVVNDGYGFTMCQHGKIPVPVPAVVEIFSDEKIVSRQIDINKELVTPTGAAIIAELAENFGLRPEMKVLKTGYGAGTRNLDIPNVLRVSLGEITEQPNTIKVLETNIDDTSPEILGYVMEKLLREGARDVYFTNIQMKKNRPAVKLTVLCTDDKLQDMERIIFSETPTIGIRYRDEQRHTLPREIRNLETPYGQLHVKVSDFNGAEKLAPEYEDVKLLAETNNVPLHKIYESIHTIPNL